MKILLPALLLYALLMNLVAFCLYAYDKRQAVRRGRRVRERTLLWVSALGGSLGAMAAMSLCRHKTRHLRFLLLNPLFLVCHGALIVFLVSMFV